MTYVTILNKNKNKNMRYKIDEHPSKTIHRHKWQLWLTL